MGVALPKAFSLEDAPQLSAGFFTTGLYKEVSLD